MRLFTRAKAAHSPIACAHWPACSPTVPADSREGVHDSYAIALTVAGEDSGTVLEKAIRALREYRIFPANRMRHAFCPSAQELTSGTTIVQRVFVGPLAVEMAVRVIDVFDHRGEDRRIGFTYVTLEGHMERGIATFSLRLSRTNEVTFHIESWSRPGNWLAALAQPLARAVQKRFTKEALAGFAVALQEAEHPGSRSGACDRP